ncbi:hypothetical protein DFH08DRAFT_992213 [Mycena albidolilacea]|uniref:Uncharacterized protein n=1 Tax=Mycena albidolilacea TaxID=1033008 RepID=A0AAD7E7H7_9AGAR|nr:hypothetical protein DFH08DRAFT_992213 [Mycena albidolilacea]
MALLTDSSSVNLPPDTIENRSDVSDMNRPIANSKDVIAPKVKAVESADGTMNTSRRPRLVRRIAPTPGTTKKQWEVATIPQMRSCKLVRRVTATPVRKLLEIDSPPHSPASSKRNASLNSRVFDDPSAARLHTLSLTGIVSVEISPCFHARKSPALDTYVGDCNDATAPGWLRWPVMAVIFAQNRAAFIGLFVNLALSPENLEAHLSTAMIEWAGAISVGTWAQSCSLGPSTPQKPTTPNNFKPIRPCARHNIYSSCSPLGRRNESLICIVDSDYESDEPESDGEGSVSWDEENYELNPCLSSPLFSVILNHCIKHSGSWPTWPPVVRSAHQFRLGYMYPFVALFFPLISSLPLLFVAVVDAGAINHHEARERRQRSTSGGGPISAQTVLASASTARQAATQLAAPQPLLVHASSLAFVAEDFAVDTTSTTSLFVAAEAEGLSYSQQVEASGELFLPISADDWELPDPSLNLAGDNSTEGPLPAEDENNPDPFYIAPKATQHLPTATEVHPNRTVYLIYVVVFWLHSQFHLPFRTCNALLAIFALALQAGGALINPPIRTTLPTVIAHLGAEPSVQILPVCPGCLEVLPVSTPPDSVCTRCADPLFPPNNPTPSQKRKNTTPENPRPYLQFPTKSLAEQLATLLSVEGVEDEIERSLAKAKVRKPGVWKNIFDGKICQELPTAEGSWFFFPSDEEVAAGELRIGATMAVDCQLSASHTSCPMSYSLINLPAHLRYRTANLLLAGIMPGPKEAIPTSASVFFGFSSTSSCGRLVRVALVAVVCDKPAAHKLGGFGSHSHTNFCTMCWITQAMKSSPEAFQENGFCERTNAQHRELQKEYLKCTSKSARDAFVKRNATRWSELHHLPYFNICEMIVIDPMHNLFLGVVKTHFYHIWVQLNVLRKTKELRTLHALLSKLKLPAHLGHLPSLIGEPVEGSITADQWLVFSIIVAPLVIPQLWQEYIPEESPQELAQRPAREIAETLEAKRAAAAAACQAQPAVPGKRARKPTARAAAMDIDPNDTALDAGAHDGSDDDSVEEDEARDNATPSNLHPDDPKNFLKLSSALKVLVAREITEVDLTESDRLIREYCQELVELYGPEIICPNHHYATHTARCVRNYGPLHEFWTFLFERLNKVLKSYKTPNHAGGELESSFFREFQRTVQQPRLLSQGAREPVGSELRQAVELMYNTTADDRGTVQALARELDAVGEDGGITFQLSTRAEIAQIDPALYFCVLLHLQVRLANIKLHSFVELAPSPDSLILEPRAILFDHVVINHTRYIASSRSAHPYNSFIAV